jgi:hypothetical protein
MGPTIVKFQNLKTGPDLSLHGSLIQILAWNMHNNV